MDVDNFKSDISIKAKASTKENAKQNPPKPQISLVTVYSKIKIVKINLPQYFILSCKVRLCFHIV